jgi:CRISPR-associated protein Csm2
LGPFGGDPNKILHPSESDYNELLDEIKTYTENKLRKISTHQLRNIFSKAKAAKKVSDLYPLRYKLAYLSGRDPRNRDLRGLCDLLDELIRNLKKDDQEGLTHFKDFFEAIIAYHKYHGGE